MVLTESDLDVIHDKVRDIATEVLQQLEQKCLHTLGGEKKDIRELQIQETKLQANVSKESGAGSDLAQQQTTCAELVLCLTMDV